eukprot:8456645-Alexandrium_andersonii.AAC.1
MIVINTLGLQFPPRVPVGLPPPGTPPVTLKLRMAKSRACPARAQHCHCRCHCAALPLERQGERQRAESLQREAGGGRES